MIEISHTAKKLNSDLDPIKVYESLMRKEKKENSENYSYLLQSAEGGEKVARFSFIGFDPMVVLRIKNSEISVESDFKLDYCGGDPVKTLRYLMKNFNVSGSDVARFTCGFVGYFSYDLVRYFISLEDKPDNLNLPDCEFILAKNNIIFDHKKNTSYILSFDSDDIKKTEKFLSDPEDSEKEDFYGFDCKFKSNMRKEDFERNVESAKEYIKAGDIFQVVLSQRFSSDFKGDCFNVYKNLKKINPSPYMFYLNFSGRKIMGSSPEMLARVEDKKVYTYPIAGTRKRGKNEKEDAELEKELLNDEKERAEHVMLVDMGRNDIGRVSEFGTVKVGKFMEIEKYSHVQHIVSEVSGTLSKEKDEFDALKSIFPAGTVSGAPKVRSMEIINELEPERRGIYAGCAGYFSFSHHMDTAIAIRTIVFDKGRVNVQVGAGIVSDSTPEGEYNETMNKAKAMFKALEIDEK